MREFVIAASVAVGAGCIAREPVAPSSNAVVDAPPAWASSTRLAIGRYWIEPAAAATTPADGAIPIDARAVTAFVDIDNDHAIDLVSEPGAPCVRAGSQWHCRLEPDTLVSYRIDEVADDVVTRFMPFAKLFDTSSVAAAKVEVCLGDDSACRTSWLAVPWSPSDVEHASVCGSTAPFVWVRPVGDDSGTRKLRTPTPEGIIAAIAVTATPGGGFSLEASTDVPTQRQILWIEKNGSWLWSTERDPRSIRSDGKRMRVEVPAHVLAGCPDCEPWLGLATQRRSSNDGDDVLEVSELRVDLRGGGFL